MDAHPKQIVRADNSRTNYAQMLPYVSLDIRKHEDVYHNIGSIFGDMFQWISQQVSLQHSTEDVADGYSMHIR